MRRLYNFGNDSIYAHYNSTPKTHEVCDKMAIDLLIRSIRVNGVIIFSYSLLVLAPLHKNFFTDEREMLLPVILPFIDPDTQLGFTINTINQMITVPMGIFVIPAAELTTCVITNIIQTTAALIENSLIEFKSLVKADKNFSNKCVLEFRNILMKIADFDRLVLKTSFHFKDPWQNRTIKFYFD